MNSLRNELTFQHAPLTKIIATIGPASASAEMVGRLIEAGVSLFRLNFSHGRPEHHHQSIQTIRQVAASLESSTAILADLPGPKIRLGNLPESGFVASTGSLVKILREDASDIEVDPVRLGTQYPAIVDDVQPGERVLINDGAVRMLAVDKTDDALICTVTHGGLITSRKGINLPDSNLSIPSITELDWIATKWAIEHNVDLLALSFVRSGDDVRELMRGIEEIKTKLDQPRFRMPIIAKIELPGAVENIESILDVADGIMIARGDLGVEMDLARVPVIQKRLIERADHHGKPCIVATQMLESMINAPAPTRAEASDVAGAIFDGVDAVMLSGETAVGQYPVIAVEHMRRIAQYTEAHLATLPQKTSAPQKLIESRYRTAALAHGVWTVAQDIEARFVVVWSQQGGGARYLSQNNFRIPIFAATSDERAARRMQLLRGVRPIFMPTPQTIEHFAQDVDEYLINHGHANPGDLCVLVVGHPIGKEAVTNSLAVHSVGSADTGRSISAANS